MENENTTLKSCSDAERWAWQEIMAGRPADFDHRYGTQLDRKKKDDWDNPERSRAISQGFIEYILTHTSPTTQPLGYIIIKRAWFPKALTCAVRKIDAPLWFDGCRFEDGVDFSSCEFENLIAFRCCFISGALTLERSYFKKTFRLEWVYIMGEVILSGARAASDVFIDGSEIHGVLTLVTAHVAGVLSLRTSTVHGSVDARLVSVDTLLTMDNAIFSTDVAFTEADVKSISICHDGHPPTFLGIFSLRGAHISRELRVRGSRFKGLVNLNNVEVGRALVITSSMLGQTYLNGARVGSHLHIKGHFEGPIVCISTSVHSDIHISGKGMSKICFTDVTIDRRLLMEGDFDGPVATSHVSCSALTMRASFKRQVNIDSCNMSQHLMVTGSTFGDTVNIVACDIAGGVAISGARFQDCRYGWHKNSGRIAVGIGSPRCRGVGRRCRAYSPRRSGRGTPGPSRPG